MAFPSLRTVRVSTRMTLAALAFVVPLGVLTFFLVRPHAALVARTDLERDGVRYAGVVARTLTAVHTARIVRIRCAEQGEGCASAQAGSLAAADTQFAALADVDRALGARLGVTERQLAQRARSESTPHQLAADWRALRTELEPHADAADEAANDDDVDADLAALVAHVGAEDTQGDEVDTRAQRLTVALEGLLAHVVESATLALDPDLDTHALIDAALGTAPGITADVTRLAVLRAGPHMGMSSEAAVVGDALASREVTGYTRALRTAVDEDPHFYGVEPGLAARVRPIADRTQTDARAVAAWIPAFDGEEKQQYALRAEQLVQALGNDVDALLAAADRMLLGRRAQRQQELGVALAVSLAITALTALFVFGTLRHVLSGLRVLTQASERIARGDLHTRVGSDRADELGLLARAFDGMTSAVAERDARLNEHANDLEKRVIEKTRDIQTVLDAMGDGLVVCDVRGALRSERSRSVEAWFGPVTPGTPVWEYFAPGDTRTQDLMRLGCEEIEADAMPFEVVADQMPQLLVRDGVEYALSYRLVPATGAPPKVCVIARDVTAERARERAEQRVRELPQIVAHIVRDKRGFQVFVDESTALLARVEAPVDEADRKHALHTLKGTVASYGFATVAARCHAAEEALHEPETAQPAIAAIRASWDESFAPLRALLEGSTDAIQLLVEEHRKLMARIEAHAEHGELLQSVRTWQNEPITSVLEPQLEQVCRFAKRTGKEVVTDLETDVYRLPDARLRPLFGALVHALRNAVAHGVETPEERVKAGKVVPAKIRVEVEQRARELVVRVEDDGRGVDWARVREIAIARGLPHQTSADLERAIFADGFSTAREADDVAGRGVGLGAVRASAEALGGTVSLRSTAGVGTVVTVSVPVADARLRRESVRVGSSSTGARP